MRIRFRRPTSIWLSAVLVLALIVSIAIYTTRGNTQPDGNLPHHENSSSSPQPAGTRQAQASARFTPISLIPGKPAPTPTPTTKPTPTPTSQTTGTGPIAGGPPPDFSGLHVEGNHLVNDQGQVVYLHGVNRSGSEYSCIHDEGFFDGPVNDAAVSAIASWNVNAVRVPMNEDCWLGINGVPAQYSGNGYKQALITFVETLNRYHIYPILELHWSAPGSHPAEGQAPMPDRDHSITFWQQVASTFKGNTTVIFDPFNEPFPNDIGDDDAAWTCWRDGTSASCSATTYNGEPYEVAGMQDLVTAIRSTGAQNVIALSGAQYANNLAGWLTYRPQDPANNLAAAWHIYPIGQICHDVACYDATVAPAAAQVPVIATEFGEGVDGACSVDNSNTLLDWLDAHSASYVAWTWNTWGSDCADLSLILDYDGTPKSPNGVNYKNRLARFGI